MDILDGKVALVTGGAMGLGKATATALLQRGCKVQLRNANHCDCECLTYRVCSRIFSVCLAGCHDARSVENATYI